MFFLGAVVFMDDSMTFLQNFGVRLVLLDHAVNGAPVGQPSDVTVVDEQIDLELSGEMVVVLHAAFLGIIPVHGIKLHPSFLTPVHCIFEQLALSDRP